MNRIRFLQKYLVLSTIIFNLFGCSTPVIEPAYGDQQSPNTCADKTIQKKKVKNFDSCFLKQVAIERNGGEEVATLITLQDYIIVSGGSQGSQYFLKFRDGNPIELRDGAILFEQNWTLGYVLSELKIHAATAGGTGFMQENWFFKKSLMIDEYGKLCIKHSMLSPFSGVALHCTGERPKGHISYLSGAITWADASEKICKLIAEDTKQKCERNNVYVTQNLVRRSEDGRFYYQITSQRFVRSFPELKKKTSYGWAIPVEYENRTYKIDALDGAITHIETSTICGPSDACTHN